MGPPGSRGITGDIGPEVCTSHFTIFKMLLQKSKMLFFAFSGKLSSDYKTRWVLVLDEKNLTEK